MEIFGWGVERGDLGARKMRRFGGRGGKALVGRGGLTFGHGGDMQCPFTRLTLHYNVDVSKILCLA